MKARYQIDMNTLCVRLLPLILLLLSAGCNGDIFIENQDRPSVSEMNIPVGGEETVRFATANLLSVEVVFDAKYDCVKYLPSGEEFASYRGVREMSLYDVTSSQPFITRLTAKNDEADFEILGDASGRVTVRYVDNVKGEPVTGRIVVKYPYSEEVVGFSIASSFDDAPVLKATKLLYRNRISSRMREDQTMFTVSNYMSVESAQTFSVATHCRMLIYFYRESGFSLKIDFDGLETEIPTWDAGKKAPAFLGGKAEVMDSPQILQAPDNVLPEGKSFATEYVITTPPMMKSVATLKWTNVDIETYATLIAVNPRNGKEHEMELKLVVVQPIDYDYSVATSTIK